MACRVGLGVDTKHGKVTWIAPAKRVDEVAADRFRSRAACLHGEREGDDT